MPDLSSCVEVDGKYYCWDEKTGELYEVEATFTPVNLAPNIKKVVKLIIKKERNAV